MAGGIHRRTYTVRSADRRADIGLAGVAVLVSCGAFVMDVANDGVVVGAALFGYLAFLALGTWVALDAVSTKLVLTGDEIQLHRLLRPPRGMRRADIRGFRMITRGEDTLHLVLLSGTVGVPDLEFQDVFERDPEFVAWFAGIPDLTDSKS